MNGIIALRKMNRVREEWLAEADAVYAAADDGLSVSDSSAHGKRARNTGWIAAAVCAAVGLGVYLAVLGFGGSLGHITSGSTNRSEVSASGPEDGTESMPLPDSITDTEPTADTGSASDTQAISEAKTEAGTVPDTETGTYAVTAADTAAVTAADTAADTEAETWAESAEARTVRAVLSSLRSGIERAVYVKQELYCIRQQPDGTEKSTEQLWGRDTASADKRFYSFTRNERGYTATGTANEVTLIGDQLYFAKARGVNGLQSKKRNTVSEARQSELRAAIDAKRLSLSTSDFQGLHWVFDYAMGSIYLNVTAEKTSDALLERLLTAAGYDLSTQDVTVTDVQSMMNFRVNSDDIESIAASVSESTGLHTTITMTVTTADTEEKLICDVWEYGHSSGHITEPENWYSGYSRETDGDTLTATVLELFHPRQPYEEKIRYVTAAALKIRATPDFGGDGNVLGYAQKGDALTVIGETDTYYIIRYEGYPAYTGKAYLSPEQP